MREKTTLGPQNGGERLTRKLVEGVLAIALLLNPASSSAQEVKTLGQKQDKKGFVANAPIVEREDSTITWDEAISWPNFEPNPRWWEISQEEIQEYLKNHEKELQELIIKNISEEKLDNETKEIVYNVLTNDEEIISVINEMVNDEDVRRAVLDWDKEYVQKELRSRLEDMFETNSLLKYLWWLTVLEIILTIIAGVIRKSHWLKFFRTHSPWWGDDIDK